VIVGVLQLQFGQIYFHCITEQITDEEGNFIFIKIRIKDKNMLLGCIYGPNKNDVGFFREIRDICENSNLDFIIGGDFNTTIDERGGEESLDRLGVGHCPNILNSREIQAWIRDGNAIEPYRVIYPETVEYSYVSFRRENTGGKNRLDWFLVSQNLVENLGNVKYEDRLGRDFDHREVTLIMGKKVGVRKEHIYSDTIHNFRAKYVGILAALDIVNEHKIEPCVGTRALLTEIENRIKRWESMVLNIGDLNERGAIIRKEDTDIIGTQIDEYIVQNINIEGLYGGEFSCNYKVLYEVLIMGIKNRLIGLQTKIRKEENHYRGELENRREMFEILEGKQSPGWLDDK
jgi:hypothetical protein